MIKSLAQSVSVYLFFLATASPTCIAQDEKSGDDKLTIKEFVEKSQAAGFGNDLLNLQSTFFLSADDAVVQTLFSVDDRWIAVTARWWQTKKEISREKNRLSWHEQRLQMENFIGFFEGRMKLEMPDRMKNSLRTAIPKNNTHVQIRQTTPISKPSSYFDRENKISVSGRIELFNDVVLTCVDGRGNTIWQTKFTPIFSFDGGRPHLSYWAKNTKSPSSNKLLYWGVNSSGAFVAEFDSVTGEQTGIAKFPL